MNILEQVVAPKRIREFAIRLNAECRKQIDTIVFTIGGERTGRDTLGRWVPELNTMYLYLDKCLTHPKWMEKGVSFITGIWLNLLTAVAHEFVHVWQSEDEPKLLKFARLPDDYEQEAVDVAIDIIDDFSEFLQPPKIEDMGWIGQEIVLMLNKLFLSRPDIVQGMLEFNGTVVAGDADAIALLSDKYEDKGSKERLLQQIDEGRMGKKIGDKRYLTFQETVGLFNSNHVEV
jgi:hypothetical protein